MTDRRARFRAYMAAMDPLADPATDVGRSFYQTPPSGTGQRLAHRLEIEPSSSHLVVGPIGSGKTSELIEAERLLTAAGDMTVIRVDVPAVQKRDRMIRGVLVGLVARGCLQKLDMGEEASDEFMVAEREVRDFTKGHFDDEFYLDDLQGGEPEDWVSGVLDEPEVARDLHHILEVVGRVRGPLGHVVALFDGMDRLHDPDVFRRMVQDDVPALRQAGIGVVVVGPRFIADDFAEEVFQEPLVLHGAPRWWDTPGQAFLASVLRARADVSILSDEATVSLAAWSGGLMRDLLSMARAAGEIAYSHGSDVVERSHADLAADRFGRSLLMSATPEMTAHLRALLPSQRGARMSVEPRELTLTSQLDRDLYLRRLLVETPDTPPRYQPHPTIAALLHGSAKKAA